METFLSEICYDRSYLVTGDSTLLHVRRHLRSLHLHLLNLNLRLYNRYWGGGLLEKVRELRRWLLAVGTLLGIPAHIFIRYSFHLVSLLM